MKLIIKLLDRPTRTKALQALQKFLSHPRKLSLLEFEKLWKGLYYSMWFSDRPRPQQRLAKDLASLFEIIPKQNWEAFNESWWVVICREWSSIDHWRLDKFLMLVRFNLNAIFRRLQKEEWDQEMVEEVLNTLKKVPLSGDKKIPNGIPFHLVDIYVDELEKVIFADVDEEDEDSEDEKKQIVGKTPIYELISVFEELSKEALYKALREKIRDELLKDERLQKWGIIEKHEKDEDKESNDNGNDEDDSEDDWNGFA